MRIRKLLAIMGLSMLASCTIPTRLNQPKVYNPEKHSPITAYYFQNWFRVVKKSQQGRISYEQNINGTSCLFINLKNHNRQRLCSNNPKGDLNIIDDYKILKFCRYENDGQEIILYETCGQQLKKEKQKLFEKRKKELKIKIYYEKWLKERKKF
ncbi:MAG: hypothetical protein U9Q69_04425 [Nanoarchaeota archaeon]|nr:hypothetical protein [Nanoarchaeota archaeon]